MLSLEGLHLRAAFFHTVRKFFHQKDFLEVDTPTRLPILIPELHITPIISGEHFLQTSPELCMKRLLAAGCEKIFQICKCFRKEERGKHHLEEFTMLEWYRKDSNYLQLMTDCEELLRFVFYEMTKVTAGDSFAEKSALNTIDLRAEWPRMTVGEAFGKYSPISVEGALQRDIFDEILVEYIEPNLGFDRPLFLYDYPVELGSLAKSKDTSPHLVERFELYFNGIELANGFSELTDTTEQRRRFEKECELIMQQENRTSEVPERFLQDLEKLDRAAGIALGIDRLFMVVMNFETVSAACSFAPDDLV